jgi:signal transduction histidine kinase
VRITVDDSGPGVPQDRRDTLFEPYITHKEQGTGLGLTIAKKIAIEHGGTVELGRDRAELGGARFILTLPLAGSEPPPKANE